MKRRPTNIKIYYPFMRKPHTATSLYAVSQAIMNGILGTFQELVYLLGDEF